MIMILLIHNIASKWMPVHLTPNSISLLLANIFLLWRAHNIQMHYLLRGLVPNTCVVVVLLLYDRRKFTHTRPHTHNTMRSCVYIVHMCRY